MLYKCGYLARRLWRIFRLAFCLAKPFFENILHRRTFRKKTIAHLARSFCMRKSFFRKYFACGIFGKRLLRISRAAFRLAKTSSESTLHKEISDKNALVNLAQGSCSAEPFLYCFANASHGGVFGKKAFANLSRKRFVRRMIFVFYIVSQVLCMGGSLTRRLLRIFRASVLSAE